MTDERIIEEQAAAAAFSQQAPGFDALYQSDPIIQYKRKRVRDHVEQFIPGEASILELNAGTGEDAFYFAQKGHYVHATDISTGMEAVFLSKIREEKLEEQISFERRSYTELETLKQQGPYDLVFSNFAGLNCTSELDKVLTSFDQLVKPGGFVTLVILPKFCLWEFLLMFKGHFKTAFRRFSGSKGSPAHIEGKYFRCWYYHPSFVKKYLKRSFDLKAIEGLCTIVPPSYIEHFAERHPKWFQFFVKKENKLKSKWPWNMVGDYYIITLQRK